MYVYIYIYIHTCMHTYVYIYIYKVCVYIYIYIYEWGDLSYQAWGIVKRAVVNLEGFPTQWQTSRRHLNKTTNLLSRFPDPHKFAMPPFAIYIYMYIHTYNICIYIYVYICLQNKTNK